jgi:diaminopimelate epimerase
MTESGMRFTKMQGTGNDFVVINGFEEAPPAEPAKLAVAACDRRTGVGADGLIVIEPSQRADARMRLWNADGSPAAMCGNGLRCVAKLLYDRRLVPQERLRIATDAGTRTAELQCRGGVVEWIRIAMGRPRLAAKDIPAAWPDAAPDEQLIERPLACGDRTVTVSCVSLGNPHCVVFVDQITDELVRTLGPELERHPVFPERTNVEFVQVQGENEVQVRVWERGVGETHACGSGACAVAVAGRLTGRTAEAVHCHMPGGTLEIEWPAQGDLYLSGPALEVFRGDWPMKNLALRQTA